MDRERLLLDYFVEIAIVEHLVRNHMESLPMKGLSAAEFGLINYFVRNQRDRERLVTLAWCFQVSTETMAGTAAELEARGFVRLEGDGEDRTAFLTEAGHAAQIEAIAAVAPDIAPLMEEFRDEELEKAVAVLKETRRIFDNLPERLGG